MGRRALSLREERMNTDILRSQVCSPDSIVPHSGTHQPGAACWESSSEPQLEGLRVSQAGAALGGMHRFFDPFATGSEAAWHQLLPAHI